MTPSIFIARILGPVLLIVSLGLLLEGETFRVMAGEFLRSPALVYFSGVTTLAIGLAILNFHHLWVRDWRVLITVFGWLFLIGGIIRLLAISWVQRVGESMIAHHRWPVANGILLFALGAFLTLKAYQELWDIGGRKTSHRASAAKSSGSTASRSGATASRSAKRPRPKPSKPRGGHSG
jgi:hypothetical protein